MAHHGFFPLWQVVIVAWVGAMCTDCGIFYVARRYSGHAWVSRQMARPVVAGAVKGVNRSPRTLASVFRFIPGMRLIAPLVLAQSEIRSSVYVAHVAIAALIWSACYSIFGVVIGEFLARMFESIPRSTQIIVVAVVVTVIAAAAGYWHMQRDRTR